MKRLSFIFFLFPLLSFSQTEDFQLWSSASINYSVNKKLEFKLTESLRLRENVSLISRQFSQLRSTYKINKSFRLNAGYRFLRTISIEKQTNLRHRFYFDIIKRKKVKRIRVFSRLRSQYQTGINYNEFYTRVKLGALYNIRKTPFDPDFSSEIYFDNKKKQIDKLRYTLALSFPFNKKIKSNIFYRIQTEKNIVNPNTFYILGLGLEYNL
tara:strand:- start:110 stop:742 length:633 start_codon:yes stop_codon:yes gene_type:complete